MSSNNVLTSTTSSGITLTSSGTYTSPFTVASTGAIIVPGGDTGLYTVLSNPTLTNEGLIKGGDDAVYLRNGGIVTNTSSGIISGSRNVVITGLPGDIVNFGTLLGTAYLGSGGVISNTEISSYIGGTVADGIQVQLGLATITNVGLIVGTVAGLDFNQSGGLVENVGSSSSIIGGYSGVDIEGVGVVLNNGTIVGGFESGILLGSGGAVTNSMAASVVGSTGIRSDRVVTIQNSGDITGTSGVGIYLDQGGLVFNDASTASVLGEYEGVLGENTYNTTIINFGTIDGKRSFGIDLNFGGTVNNYGTISGGYGAGVALRLGLSENGDYNLLIVNPDATFLGTVEASGTNNILELAAGQGQVTGIGTSFVGFNTIVFGSDALWSIEGNETGLSNGEIISGFTAGDTILLDGFTTGSHAFAHNALTLTQGSSSVTLDITGDYSTNSFVISDTQKGTEIVICYLEGTRILTPAGEVSIEKLDIGDTVITRFGGYQKIKWIGRQSYSKRFVVKRSDQIPVLIMAGAFAENLPKRDLFVSPGHSMLIKDNLILARSLINGITIIQNTAPDEIYYYQLEFETHDCVMAEGVWSESYADTPQLRGKFHNVNEFYTLFPEHQEPDIQILCAPRPENGPRLYAALYPIVERAASSVLPGKLIGYIDQIEPSGMIRGWARDLLHPELPVLLNIVVLGRVIGQVLACDYRSDLDISGLGGGRCAFVFNSPVGLPITIESDIKVCRAIDSTEIFMSPNCMVASGIIPIIRVDNTEWRITRQRA